MTEWELEEQILDGFSVEDWHERGQYFLYKDQRVFYVAEGQGQTIFCIHGFPGCSWDWRSMWQKLSQKYQVIALDFLGNGLSDKPEEYNYSVADQADAVEALCTHLGVAEKHLLAHGSGVAVAMELLARQLENSVMSSSVVSALLLNSSLLQARIDSVIEVKLIQQLGEDMTQNLNSAFLANGLNSLRGPLTKLLPHEQEENWALLKRENGLNVLAKLMHYLPDRREHYPRWSQAMENSAVPLHAVIGDADPVWGEEIRDYLRNHFVHVGLSVLPEIGHYPHLEDAESVLAACDEFFLKT